MALTRTQTRELLARHGLRPSRALGQNFLCDPNVVDKIVRLGAVGEDDRVVEIGSGLGALTLGLCRAGARVVAVEVDDRLIPPLTEVIGTESEVVIIDDDVRNLDWDHTLSYFGAPETWKVIANLPYNIASPLLLDLLASQPRLDSWLVMVQKEVGQRLVAKPGSKSYGIPSVLVSYWANGSIVGHVSSELFMPRPRVESVLVALKRHNHPVVEVNYDSLAAMVRAGFGQRRKMLRGSLAAFLTPEDIAAAGISPTARAEQLCLKDWARLVSQATVNGLS